jgi:hypothetical protein
MSRVRLSTENAELVLSIQSEIHGADEVATEEIRAILHEEARRFAARLADELEAAGIDYVKITSITGD